jgi:hypothetical protein
MMGVIVGLAAILLLTIAVLHVGDLESFGRMLKRAQPYWLLAALALQVSIYVSVSLGWASVLGEAGTPQRLRKLLPIAISKLFADQVIPSAGLGGNMLLVDIAPGTGAARSHAIAHEPNWRSETSRSLSMTAARCRSSAFMRAKVASTRGRLPSSA